MTGLVDLAGPGTGTPKKPGFDWGLLLGGLAVLAAGLIAIAAVVSV